MLGDARPSTEDDSDKFVSSMYLIIKSEESVLYSMESMLIVLVSALLFRYSDAGTFTWLHSDDAVNVVEGETAKLNWSVRIGAGKTWFAVNINRNIRDTSGAGDVDMIRRKRSGVEILLAERGADMDLDVQANMNVLNVTFTLRNLSRETDEMYYRITVYDDDPDSSVRTTKLNVDVSSSCEIHPNTTTVNETDNVLLNVTTTGNPPVYDYIWTHPNGSTLTANSTLTFTASRQDTGTYNVSVNNGVGNRSICTSNVTVRFPSSCEIHPNENIAVEGTNVWLNVTTTGYPPVYEYIWTHPNGSRLTANSTLTFNASRQDTGTYNVSVYNGVGDRSYCTSNVTVLYKSVNTNVSLAPNVTIFCLGSLINITCTSKANPLVEKYSLYRNEEWVQENITGLFKVLLNKTGISRFTCVPENQIGVGENKSLTPINVTEPPKISNCTTYGYEKGYASAVEGRHVTLRCNISGSEPLNTTWTNGQQVWNDNTVTFEPVNRSDTGTYNLTVSNGEQCNKAETSYYLDVYYKPESTNISHSPNKTTFCLGSLMDITCTSNANPPVENYSLYRNEKLVQENNVGLFIVLLNKTGTSRLTCVPENQIGVGENKSLAPINVTAPPGICRCQILENGKEQAFAVEGRNVTLRCDISGSEPLNITWTNGQQVWNNNTVTFEPVNRSDTGTYNLTVSNGEECNKAETSYYLDVYYVPGSTTMEIYPNKTTFCRGDQIYVNCTASAKPPANYSLYQNNELMSRSRSGIFVVELSTSGNIIFTCVSNNEAGYGENSSATLEVKASPGIINCQLLENGKKKAFAVEGRNVTLRCDISGSEPLNITWTNGRQLWNDNTVTFEPVNRSDTGTYNLTVSNGEECNKAETSFKLDVYYVPDSTTMEIYPNKTTFCRGDQIHVSCTASAKPQANYSLYQNDELMSSSRSGIVVNLNVSGNIIFTCVPSNEAGYGQNISLRIVVEEPPAIANCTKIIGNTHLANEAVIENENVKVMCNISGSDPLNVSWTYETRVWYQEHLVFPSISRKDAGTYEIQVKSGRQCKQKAKQNVTLKVHFPPDRITCNNKTVLEGDDVELVCSANGNPPPDMMWIRKGNVRGSGNTLLIKGVTKSEGGPYTFFANNSLGQDVEEIFITVKYLEPLEVIGSRNKSYSQSNPLVLFNLSINAYPSNTSLSCNPSAPNILTTITSHDAGLTGKQYLVFAVIQKEVDSASIVCKAENSVGVRERTLHFYRQPILLTETFTGQFRIINQEWQDELQNAKSAAYDGLKQTCIKILVSAYFGVPYLTALKIKDFIKGSIIVRFELDVIGKVPDPLLPLRNYTKRQGEEINGLQIDSIQKSIDPKGNSLIPVEKQNKILVIVLGVLFGLSIVLNIIFITGSLWSRRKASKENNSGKRPNKRDEMGQINDISLQETSFNDKDNETPNVPEYEPIGRRGLSTSDAGTPEYEPIGRRGLSTFNAGIPEYEPIGRRGLSTSNARIPEYEAVTTRTRPRQPYSGIQTNNPMPQYESADQHRQTGATSSPPPIIYQNIQPRTRVLSKGIELSSTGSPTRTGEYQALQHKGVSPQYQSLDGLSKC